MNVDLKTSTGHIRFNWDDILAFVYEDSKSGILFKGRQSIFWTGLTEEELESEVVEVFARVYAGNEKDALAGDFSYFMDYSDEVWARRSRRAWDRSIDIRAARGDDMAKWHKMEEHS